MTAPSLRSIETPGSGHAFDLDDDVAYRAWRGWKLQHRPADAAAITVDVVDPCALSVGERDLLLSHIAHANMALYRSPPGDDDRDMPRRLGAQLGLQRLDANWLADEDGISSIQVSSASDGRGGFIPYTDRAIRWHTDGYYHPADRRICGMVLHCVRPAAGGGVNALMDPELAYIALRDANPAHIRALMQPTAMTIPAREDDDGVARAAQTGPVFAINADGSLHMRYTARTRSIEWAPDAATSAAVAALQALLDGASPHILRLRMEPGMGLVSHNVLHDRSAFEDDPASPRLLYRARFLDRAALPAWPAG